MSILKATGIVVEYNPFHNGHKLHATEARKTTNAQIIIAVMSGNFLQRGEPAFVDKWARTEMALQNGIDIVFELPYAFATAHAPTFAEGAIKILDAACCDFYCFGSEDGHIQPFENSMALLDNQHTQYERKIKEAVQHGISYPQAVNAAYKDTVQTDNTNRPYVDLSKPNNILGFHYMQAAKQINSNMQAATIQRMGAAYHDEELKDQRIASATGIRKSYFETNTLHDTQNFLPGSVYQLLKAWQGDHSAFGSWKSFYPLLRLIILRDGPKRLAHVADVTEGIENLFYRAAVNHDTFDGFMHTVKSKRYTWTRIQRMLTHIFTGYSYNTRSKINTPTYLRLLGMTQAGRLYLNKQKKNFKLPIVSKVSSFSDPSLDIDIHAANLYALGLGKSEMNVDYKNIPIFIRESQ
ncbi:nucleotidyltransferase [Sporosarcina ureilytica]|uniref:nucleotidyltransferase n=1 Tax=Sporosarcina ureilytica TaxID=298596 RepID=UPI001FE0A67E|nr:nucleotidyltransferase [Sporosarcina ureilytica]